MPSASIETKLRNINMATTSFALLLILLLFLMYLIR